MDAELRQLYRLGQTGDLEAQAAYYYKALRFAPSEIIPIVANLGCEPAKALLPRNRWVFNNPIEQLYSFDRWATICIAYRVTRRALNEIFSETSLPMIEELLRSCSHNDILLEGDDPADIVQTAIALISQMGNCDYLQDLSKSPVTAPIEMSKNLSAFMAGCDRQEIYELHRRTSYKLVRLGHYIQDCEREGFLQNRTFPRMMRRFYSVLYAMSDWVKIPKQGVGLYHIGQRLHDLCYEFDPRVTWRHQIWMEEILKYYLDEN